MSEAKEQRDWSIFWTLVFLFNLPVPLVLGGMVTDHRGGGIGMALGIAVLWTLGLAICAWASTLRRILVVGGWLVALCQFVFFLHFFIGAFALETWGVVTGNKSGLDGRLSELGGFAVTLMTGQLLMVLALIFGGVAYCISTFGSPVENELPESDG